MDASLVSIITPTYNSEKFITETIQSVQKQSYANWEMLIVDDCSTDYTVSIVSAMSKNDSRIRFFQLEENHGTGVARDLALSKASGRYITFLDSDDLWKPCKLEKQIDFLRSKNLPFTFSFYECIDGEGKALDKIIEAPKKLRYYQLFFCNFIGNLTGIYDTSFFGKIPISSIRKRQDWMLWLTILKKIQVAMPVPESLAYYRVRDNSISASKINLLQHNLKVYRSFHGLNFVVSLFCMVGFLCTQLMIKPFYTKKI